MAKERSGYCFQDKEGRWYARLTFTDGQGRRRNIKRRTQCERDARKILSVLLREAGERDERALVGARMTFDDLADYFSSRYVKPAEYVHGRKVAGLRTVLKYRSVIRTLRKHFGRKKLSGVTYSEVERYKAVRLKTPTRLNRQRSIASVNRELATLRRMLNVAVREGWVRRNPFGMGDPLISLADERRRERVLTREEEARLLAACTGRRAHLRPIIVAALDTGCRKGELLQLRWRDIDFDAGAVTIQAFNTKTMRERVVSLTTRLAEELRRLREQAAEGPDALVFGVTDDVKRSFASACRAAGVFDFRFHDLRHTAATRLVGAHMPIPEVGRVLGHTQADTTYRYVNANLETARRAAAALDAFNSATEEVEPSSEWID